MAANDPHHTDVALIGAGPIGIEIAIAFKKAGIDYLQFEKGQVGETISTIFPPGMRFFSSNDRILLANTPIHTTDQSKCSKDEYLAYMRMLVGLHDLQVNSYEPVMGIDRNTDGSFTLTTERSDGRHIYQVNSIVLATGDTHFPNMLNIPGEDLPHVSHHLADPHKYFRKRLMIVGGKNSAAEGLLRCYHAGADVSISYRRDEFDPEKIKYWLLPEIKGRIRRDEIHAYMGTVPIRITPTHVTLQSVADESTIDVEADFVVLHTGYVADMTLFESIGVELAGKNRIPTFNESSMQTNVPNVYVAGTATAGTQQSYKVFLENCHIHADRIVASLTGQSPPDTPESARPDLPES